MRVTCSRPFCQPKWAFTIQRTLLLAGLAWATSAAWAQAPSYPQRPVKIVVGYPAGGASDVAARIIGHKLAERLGQPVVIENRPGSAGNLGADAVAKAPADGYTLLLGTISLAVNPSLYPKMSYDPVKDLRAIGMISSTPFLLVVNPQSPYKTVADLLDASRKTRQSGAINYATAGNGSGAHLFTELLASTAHITLTHIPYKGAAPAMNDVLGNQVSLTFDNIITTLPLVKSGKLRALAVSTRKRSRVAPDIPTLDESGVTGFDATAWFGLFAPQAVPKEIVARLNLAVRDVVQDVQVGDKLLQLGAEPMAKTSDEFDAFFKGEVAKWEKVVQSSKIHVD